MVLVGAVISLARFPLVMSHSPGAPSLVAALSSVGLVWPLLGECCIVIAAVRAVAARVASPSHRTTIVERIVKQRRAGVALVGAGGALLLTMPLVTAVRALGAVASGGSVWISSKFYPADGIERALFISWTACLAVGAALLIASEIELRRRA